MSDYENYLREDADRYAKGYANLSGAVEALTEMGLGTDEYGIKIPPREALRRIAAKLAEVDKQVRTRRTDR